MTKIELTEMCFFSHHGCFEEEQIIGNKFIVNLTASYDGRKAQKSDNVEDALNYQLLYNVVAEQMRIKSHLLENVAYRILSELKCRFPQMLEAVVSIDKLNPPLGGQVGSSRVVMSLGDLAE